MANLPESFFVDPPFEFGGSTSSLSNANPNFSRETNSDNNNNGNPISVEQLILALESESREQALALLVKIAKDSRNRKSKELAPLLWNSFNTVFILVQEVITVYRILSKPNLVEGATGRVCNAVALLQCLTSHSSTRKLFVKANIHYYLYPLIYTTRKETSYEHLRLTSLAVIGAIVKDDEPEMVYYLLESEIFPHCLRCIECGAMWSKIVATFIIQKLLLQDEGLVYCCSFPERLFSVASVLGKVVYQLHEEQHSLRLLKHIIACYRRLSDSVRARGVLRQLLPAKLRDQKLMFNLFKDDQMALDWLRQLWHNVFSIGDQPSSQSVEHLYGLLIKA